MSNSGFTLMPEPARRIEVFTGAGRRRNWSSEAKAMIVAESYAGSETVCAVARRHGLTPQQLFTWRRLARQAGMEAAATFVPAVLAPAPALASKPDRRRSTAAAIELEIAGVVVRVADGADAATVATVIRALKE
ncbi:MAG: transposase [Planctomycetes bacterium]|nr:transposase [Planctomycetota bacterium]